MIEPFGDRAFLVVLGGGISPRVNRHVHAFAEAVRTEASQGVAWGNPVPSYESVVVPFDPLLLDPAVAQDPLRRPPRGDAREADDRAKGGPHRGDPNSIRR